MSRRASTPGAREQPTPLPEIRGQRVLEWLHRPLLYAERLIDANVPSRFNPLGQTGAIANTTLLVAIASGIVLLIWYSPSVTKAYDSVLDMDAAPLGAGLMRSLHRYSSDACVLFTVLHGLKCLLARQFSGPRWLGWVTGIFLIVTLWLAGWIGYWLVWDQRGQQVAIGSARFLDQLPIVTEPLSREFLTDGSITSLLFFIVFYVHVLIALPMAVALWLHIVRVSRPHFLTDLPMTLWTVGTLIVVSAVVPANTADPAQMAVMHDTFTMDWWYLVPVLLTDRLGGGALWAVFFVGTTLLVSIPWSMRRRKIPAAVVAAESCNACRTCFEDCPYEAITMIPRDPESIRSEPEVARVDPSHCVGCGVCAGSCNTAGIGLTWLPVLEQRARQDAWLEAAKASGEEVFVAFICGESAGAGLEIDPETGACPGLPGYRVQAVPCAGWVHALTIERALRHGAKGVLVVGCPDRGCMQREGSRWTADRLAGARKPALRHHKIDSSTVRFVGLDRTNRSALATEAQRFRHGQASVRRLPSRTRAAIAAVTIAATFSVVTAIGSDLAYPSPPGTPELVVSFFHPGQTGENCRELDPEELAKRPVHMRKAVECERRRAPVRLRITVDGERRANGVFAPAGFAGDGNSLAIERIDMAPGEHHVVVELGDTLDEQEWNYRTDEMRSFEPHRREVLLFDKERGFQWH